MVGGVVQWVMLMLPNYNNANKGMGNQSMQGIPAFLSRNWQPVPEQPNTFRNRLTLETARKHILKVEEPIEIESFKYRMHENNPFLCRVLYYHEYTDSIYHVYTDEMHLQPPKPAHKWPHHKLAIIETFRNLAELFGYTRVCRQMVGTDSNGQIKVWIHPDPVSCRVWSPCNGQSLMVQDIVSVLQSIQEACEGKSLNKTYDHRHRVFYSFDECIRQENKKIAIAQKRNKPPNHVSAAQVNNSTTNFNININIELDPKGKPILKHTPYNPQHQIYTPVQCGTKRAEGNPYNRIENPKNFMVDKPHRPSTEYSFHKPIGKLKGMYKTENNTKRRDSDYFRSMHENSVSPIKKTEKNSSAVPSVGKKYGGSPNTTKNSKKNVLDKLFFHPHTTKNSAGVSSNTLPDFYKVAQHSPGKKTHDRPIFNAAGTNRVPQPAKNTVIPNFLVQRNLEPPHMKFRTCSSVEKHPSTGRKSRNQVIDNESEMMEINLSPIGKQARQDNGAGSGEDQLKNTMSLIKEELNNILDTPIINQPPVSPSFEHFKASKALYMPSTSKEQEVEMEQIKEKVEKKKATFAHLKFEAMKILQDDF